MQISITLLAVAIIYICILAYKLEVKVNELEDRINKIEIKERAIYDK